MNKTKKDPVRIPHYKHGVQCITVKHVYQYIV